MKKLFITTLFSAVFTIVAIAQNGTVKGKVADNKTNEGIPGATIQDVANPATGAASNIDGEFTLSLPAGKYSLIVKSISKRPITKTVNVTAGETISLNFIMEDEAQNIGLVVVSESKYSKPVEQIVSTIDIIKPTIVENKATTSMDQAMQQAPGVAIVDGEAQIRGGSGYSFGAGSRVMVLIDDLPILSGDAGRPSWGLFPIENIEQIEVVKGASSVLYGSAALSGAINIRTAYPRDTPITKVTLMTQIYDFPNKRTSFYNGNDMFFASNVNFLHSRRIGALDMVVAANLFKDTGYKGREVADTILNYNSGIGGTVYVPKVKDTGPNGEITLRDPRQSFEQRARGNFNLRYRNQKVIGLNYGVNGLIQYSESAGNLLWLNSKEDGPTPGLYYSYPGSNTLTKQTTYAIDPFLNYSNDMGSTHRLRTRFYGQNNNNDGGRANKFDLLFGEYQYTKRFSLADSNSTGFGGELARFFTEKASVTGGFMGTSTKGEAALYEGNEAGDGKSSSSNGALYVQFENRYRDRFTFILGARYEFFKINDQTGNKPVVRAGFNYKLSRKGIFRETYIRGSFGQGYRFPTIAEKYIRTNLGAIAIYPNTNLQPESSWNAEIGIKQGIKVGKAFVGYLDVAYFHQRSFNTIEFTFGPWGSTGNVLDDIGFRSLNIGLTETRGVDMSLMGTGKIGNTAVNFLFGYTYMDPRALEPDKQIATFDPLFQAVFGIDPTYKGTSSEKSGGLKYRFNHLVKADLEFVYKRLMIGASCRYNSYMKNIDIIFEKLDPLLNYGLQDFRSKHNKGDYIVDARIGVDIAKHSRVSFVVNNALNRVYTLRPLDIAAPRTFAVQYQLKF
jgi:outer membrane receptor protein involved in Fe transport